MVSQSNRSRPRKQAAPVLVQPADIAAGVYEALSSKGDQWYAVNVAARTCTCPAGAAGFATCKHVPYCRHLIAARVIARALASMSPADRAVALRMQNVRVHVERVDIAALDQPLRRPAAQLDALAALDECYATAA